MDLIDVVPYGIGQPVWQRLNRHLARYGQVRRAQDDASPSNTQGQLANLTVFVFSCDSDVNTRAVLTSLKQVTTRCVAIFVDWQGDSTLPQQFHCHTFLHSKDDDASWFSTVNRAMESASSRNHQTLLTEFARFNLYGCSRLFVKVLRTIKQVARCDAPVLIEGETGTGKENTARAVHYLSDRQNNAFIPINCAAIPENLIESELFGYKKGAYTGASQSQKGLVEIADGGTLFLDEVDSLSYKAQAVLLRFLQTGEYHPVGSPQLKSADVHVIAATNCDLQHAMDQHQFREDLYYRLNVLKICIPPLRDRPEDIGTIAKMLIERFKRRYDREEMCLAPSSLLWLAKQPWPGNVRELENTLLREFLMSETQSVQIGEMPSASVDYPELPVADFKTAKSQAIALFEKNYVQQVMALSKGNISQAARLSGKERRAFGKLVKKYQIEKGGYR